MDQLPRRAYQRHNCEIPVLIYSPQTQAKLTEARILNVSLGGVAVECSMTLERWIPYEFHFQDIKEKLKLTGRVVWESPRNRKTNKLCYGISFNLSTRQEAILKTLVNRIQLEKGNKDDGRLKDYWNL